MVYADSVIYHTEVRLRQTMHSNFKLWRLWYTEKLKVRKEIKFLIPLFRSSKNHMDSLDEPNNLLITQGRPWTLELITEMYGEVVTI
jgi:hypothetical protein